MPMRYGERVLAARGGMARVAKEQDADDNCHMEVATDEVREATQSHAFESPVPGEHRGEVHAPNAGTWMYRLGRSEAGCRSVAV